MGRKWIVEIEDKKYVVEAKYGKLGLIVSGSGEVLVDGKVIDAWGSSFGGLATERTFEIAGKKATLRRKGLVNQNLELFISEARVIRV